MEIWYVVASGKHKESTEGYPLLIYADKGIAEAVAKANGEMVVPVVKLKDVKI